MNGWTVFCDKTTIRNTNKDTFHRYKKPGGEVALVQSSFKMMILVYILGTIGYTINVTKTKRQKKLQKNKKKKLRFRKFNKKNKKI